jgi:acetyl-CoA C-acetyltransferase
MQAADRFARQHQITRSEQERFAIASHAKAMRMPGPHDPFTRLLSEQLCARMPPLGLNDPCGITAATVAPEADGAAAVLVVSETLARQFPWAIEIIDAAQTAGDPMQPPLAAVAAAQLLLQQKPPLKTSRSRIKAVSATRTRTYNDAPVRNALGEWGAHKSRNITCFEIMESFAAQALYTQRSLGIDAARMNRRGGMLAIGHPIGASGAVLIGNLFLELQRESNSSMGLAAIAAAGGLGSAMLLKKP